ncbi:Uncharacterised protein [Acidipropionibacterium jensenii]|uniref:Uncharacterized protein n=1 Tax=Acidipropionibacterium jensenii TaxID=1749 RepID=A0A3S4W747_9ACTN|nr:Uncharacterised protein [Acidipropionibacterium jensenii]
MSELFSALSIKRRGSPRWQPRAQHAICTTTVLRHRPRRNAPEVPLAEPLGCVLNEA